MSDRSTGTRPTTLLLGPEERLTLLELAHERAVEEGRPVSISEAARRLIRSTRPRLLPGGSGPRRAA